jgi:cyclophilin family peptidyl-prolyl cis-trans isomerase
MKINWLLAALAVFVVGLASPSAFAASPDNTLVLELKGGEVRIALRPDLAPKHVERIKTLVEKGAYNNVAFHRVIEGFMAQTGDVKYGNLENGYDPNLVGTGGSDLPNLPAEFSDVPYERGVVGMARSRDPNSANSQFFIMFAPAPSLNGAYTVIGQVESGMEAVDAIKKGSMAQNGSVENPDRIISAHMASDK